MAWRLPDGKTIKTPKGVLIGDVNYPADIFYKWSKQELAAIGIKPFREEKYDKKWFRSSGHVDVDIDGEIVRQHTTVEKYSEARQLTAESHFIRLELCDTAVFDLCRMGIGLVTDDRKLAAEIWGAGMQALNFNHLRLHLQ